METLGLLIELGHFSGFLLPPYPFFGTGQFSVLLQSLSLLGSYVLPQRNVMSPSPLFTSTSPGFPSRASTWGKAHAVPLKSAHPPAGPAAPRTRSRWSASHPQTRPVVCTGHVTKLELPPSGRAPGSLWDTYHCLRTAIFVDCMNCWIKQPNISV